MRIFGVTVSQHLLPPSQGNISLRLACLCFSTIVAFEIPSWGQAVSMSTFKNDASAAMTKCDPSQDEGIQEAKKKASEASASKSESSTQKNCQQMQSLSDGASKALGEFKQSCQPYIKKCQEDIKAFGNNLGAEGEKYKAACESAQKQLSAAESEMASNQQQSAASAECQSQTGGMPQMPQMPNTQSSPTPTPTPAQDCSNATFAASNAVCKCRMNPAGEGCGSAEPSIEDLLTDRSQSIDNSPVSTASGPIAHQNAMAKKSVTGQAKLPGGAGGGASLGGGGKSGPAGAAADAIKTDGGMLQIKSGSGGGGGATGGGGSSSAGGGYSDAAVLAMQRQQAMGRTGRAPGSVGPDGITGPHSDLFRKVHLGYQRYHTILSGK